MLGRSRGASIYTDLHPLAAAKLKNIGTETRWETEMDDQTSSDPLSECAFYSRSLLHSNLARASRIEDQNIGPRLLNFASITNSDRNPNASQGLVKFRPAPLGRAKICLVAAPLRNSVILSG